MADEPSEDTPPPACMNCLFHRLSPKVGRVECHLEPPRLLEIAAAFAPECQEPLWVWPLLPPDDLCGQYAADYGPWLKAGDTRRNRAELNVGAPPAPGTIQR